MSFAPITEGQRKCIEKEIKYDPIQYKAKTKIIREWMSKQPHFPQLPEKSADKLIQAFLYGTKLSTEAAKTKLDTYFAMRHQMADLFEDRDPTKQEIRDSGDKIWLTPLSELTPEGYRVTIISYNPDKRFTPQDERNYCKRVFAIVDTRLMLLDDLFGGEILVIDCRGFYFSYIAQVQWALIQKTIAYAQIGLPLRVKGVYLINAAPYMEKALNIVRIVINEKIRKRIQLFQGDHTNLYKYIPQRILPSDFGGEAPSIVESSRAWQKTIENYRDFLTGDSAQMTDETLRPRDSTNSSGQLFGVNGSFCKLNID